MCSVSCVDVSRSARREYETILTGNAPGVAGRSDNDAGVSALVTCRYRVTIRTNAPRSNHLRVQSPDLLENGGAQFDDRRPHLHGPGLMVRRFSLIDEEECL